MESDSYPVFEITKPFCTCGTELSSYYYELTGAESFRSIMSGVLGDKTESVIETIFVRDPNLTQYSVGTYRTADLKFCCKMSLRFGRFNPLSLEDPREGVNTDQVPVALPSVLNKRKRLYWAQ